MSNSKIPESDQKTWENFLNNPNQYSDIKNSKDKETIHNPKILSLDLHGMDVQTAYKKTLNSTTPI